jgi:hypothetical protein
VPDKPTIETTTAVMLEALPTVPLATLADLLGVRPATLRQRIARGSLQAHRFGPLWAVPGHEAARAYRAGRGARSGRISGAGDA